MTTNLPVPDPIAQQHSDQLIALIKREISDAGGKLSFADYMQLCLYSPGLGYYSAGSQKIGAGGDFTTAPEISSLFSRTLAQHIYDVFVQLERPNILEFGAGSGKMAIDILKELKQKQCLPERYYIIEASADLRQRQEELILSLLPDLFNHVVWLEKIPDNFVGVVLANEVCDAMPVHCIHFDNGHVNERYLEVRDDVFVWGEGELSHAELKEHISEIQSLLDNNNIITEVNLAAKSWLASVADSLKQGAMFVIDYGYSQAEYYHPQRTKGTLMCYYQHQGHDDPLILQGLQDITAHVDFTALANVALTNNLDVAGFQSQADFLLAGGIVELLSSNEQQEDVAAHLQSSTEIKQLTLPSEMGESFKVLSLTKDLDDLLLRIQLGDRRYNL